MKPQLSQQTYYGLGQVPIGIGAVLNGWQYGSASVLDFRAMTEKCPHNCFHCFTDKRKKTLSYEDITRVITEAKDLGFKGINYLGEGEPTIDNDFFDIIEFTSDEAGLVPIVFTDAATMLRDNNFVGRLYDSGASVCPKCDSLFNAEYQNWVVNSDGDWHPEGYNKRYFRQRNGALDRLMAWGFATPSFYNKDNTSLGFDMVVTKRNVDEVEKTLRYCRDNNIWIAFSTYLPAGRCSRRDFDDSLTLSKEELTKMRATVQRVDAEYGFNHPIFNNFATFPCVEFMQVYGNGDVSPCPGNETIVGNVRTSSLKDLADRIKEQFPCHRLENQTGNCAYRKR